MLEMKSTKRFDKALKKLAKGNASIQPVIIEAIDAASILPKQAGCKISYI